MRLSLLGLVLLTACADSGSVEIKTDDDAVIVDDTDAGGTDTDAGGTDTDPVVDTDTDGGGGGGGNGGGNGGVDTDVDPAELDPFGPDPLLWNGLREFHYDYGGRGDCDLSVDEGGEQVYGAGFLAIERACADCQRVFRLNLDPDGWCGSGFADVTYRGLKFLGGDKVEIHVIAQAGPRWTSELLATGDLAGNTITYTYSEGQIGFSYDVKGSVTLE